MAFILLFPLIHIKLLKENPLLLVVCHDAQPQHVTVASVPLSYLNALSGYALQHPFTKIKDSCKVRYITKVSSCRHIN